MPSSEKDEYLASLSIPNVNEDLTDLGSKENTQPFITSEVADVDHSADGVVENPEIHVDQAASETSMLTDAAVSDEFTLDFINLEAREPEILIDNTQLPEIAEQPATENLVDGEFISLEDDTDLKHEDIFELQDDVEISLIAEQDLQNLYSVVIDSDQIVDFPWNGPSEIIENKIPEDSTNVSFVVTQEGIQDIELPNPISDSAEIEINPLDNSVEQDDSQLQKDGTGVITSDQPVSASNSNVLEETPWGETIGSASDEDAGSLSEVFQKVEENISKLISSPEEITEYPWGESVSAEEVVGESIDAGALVEELPIVEVHTRHLAGFDDVEEFPWGEQNVHFNPETISANSETIGEMLPPESGMEHENIGIIVGNAGDPVFYSQLPPSFSDITEFPWGESILNQPLGQNTGITDFTDSPIDHNIDHTSMNGAE
jgi:hypothetical protein